MRGLNRIFCALTLTAWAAAAGARYSEPVTVEGVEFQPRHELADIALTLTGYGVATARIFFDVYAAALYLPNPDEPAPLAADTSRRLEIQYLLSIEAKDLARAANTILERQHDSKTLEPIRDEIDRFHGLYRDVEPGDRYAMTYRPGVGTVLTLNGVEQGRIMGAEFARVYFGIWLGEAAPLSKELRTELLGLR